MRVAVLVPRRPDNGPRDEAWSWIKDRWATEHPTWDVVEGDHLDGMFNRAAAINRAAELAGDWETAVIADADTFVDQAMIETAVAGSNTSGCEFWLAYDSFHYLSRSMSRAIMRGFQGWWEAEWIMTGTCSSMVVATRRLFDRVGGFDEGFRGWGFEDVAFSNACQTFGGGLRRVPGQAWHLWHPPSLENNHHSPEWCANRERALRYGEAIYKPDDMDALLTELGVT